MVRCNPALDQRQEILCLRDNLLGLSVGRDRSVVIVDHIAFASGTPRKSRGADGHPHQALADRPQMSTDDGPTCSQVGSRRRQWPSLRSATRRCRRWHTADRQTVLGSPHLQDLERREIVTHPIPSCSFCARGLYLLPAAFSSSFWEPTIVIRVVLSREVRK